MQTISAKRAFEIISMNKRGVKPEDLKENIEDSAKQRPVDLVEQESLTRFDKRKTSGNRKKKKKQQPTATPENHNLEKKGNTPNKNGKNREKRNNNHRPKSPNEEK